MNKQFLRFTFFLLMCLTSSLAATAQVVSIPDSNLRAAIEDALSKTSGDTITVADMARLPHLEAGNANIRDLTGLEHANNLTSLDLGYEKVANEWRNSNAVTDLSPLAGLTQLTFLHLPGNSVSDISAVADLTNLTRLNLWGNSVSDLSPVERLTKLTELWLGDNNISDLSPLVANTGLGSGDTVNVQSNPLSYLSIHTHIPTLKSRGVTVQFDNRTPATIRKIPSVPISSDNVLTVDVRDENGAPFEGVPVIFTIISGSGTLSVTHTVTNKNGRAETLLTLGFDEEITTVRANVEGLSESVTFTHSVPTNGMVRPVYFLPSDRPPRPDRVAALRELIKDAQQFFADEMERHGYGRKTFTVETDENGEPVAHRIDGKFTEDYYYREDTRNTDFKIWAELYEHFNEPDALQHVYFIAIDHSYELLSEGGSCGLAGVAFFPSGGDTPVYFFGAGAMRHRDLTEGEEALGGSAIIPASGNYVSGATLHELGHTFGLDHDYREGIRSDYAMSSSGVNTRLSACAAEWLSVSRFFNTKTTFLNEPGEIRLLSLRAHSHDAINLRFEVTDPDGLHQAQLLVPEIRRGIGGWGPYRLFDCKRLNGTTDTVESTVRTAELVDRITLQIIDMGGNITWTTFPIQLDEAMLARNALDINSDKVMNISDLVSLASRFGQKGKYPADVNEDGVVDIVDVLLVAASISSLPRQAVETFTMIDVQKWLTDAKQLEAENEALKKGITVLEHLLAEINLLSQPMEVTTGQLRAFFAGHTDNVWSVAFSPDGKLLASGSADQTIRLWNTTTWQVERTLTGHTTVVDVVAFSPDGAILASGSRDQTIRLWNPNTGQLLHTLTEHRSEVNRLVFSPDGQTLASRDWDGIIRLWNTDTGTLKRTLPNQGGWANTMAFSSDGKTLTIGNRGIALWDLETGQYKEPLAEDIGDAVSVVFSLDGTMLASGSADNLVRLWDFTPFLITPGLSKHSGDNQTGGAGAVLANPLVVQVRDENLSTLEGISVTFTITAGDGTLSVTRTTTDENGRAEGTLTLGPNQGTNTVSVSAAGMEGTVTFTAVAGAPVDIPDPNLRAAIAKARGRAPGTPIAPSDMAGLARLEARNANISDLTGLEHAIHLSSLNLSRELVGGKWVNSNSVSNLSPLSGLTSLTDLWLENNAITDISPVAGLINLSVLQLGGNTITDISALSSLVNLTVLAFWDNNVTDISPLAGLTRLTALWLDYNTISDLSPLVANTGLGSGDRVYVRGNPLSYQSIHTHIPTLQSRGVTVEFDADGTRSPDVNGDGNVDVLDLIAVTSYFGNTGENIATDVSGDGVVDVLDLVLVAGSFDGMASAPSAQSQIPEALTAVEVRGWLTEARTLQGRDSIMQRGILVLQQLLVALTPTETELLANYPNPFNPETWIPYRLAEDAFVTLTIYDGSGHVVRPLNVGHRIASAYESRSKAIHWNGTNGLGEQVASGVYFYTLTAGDFSATRRMLILK